jgi:hypothetical protein
MVQRRIARSWDDVPEAVRDDVYSGAEGDIRRVELIDRPDGGYGVEIHPTPIALERDASAVDDPAFAEVIERVRPTNLSGDGPAAHSDTADAAADPDDESPAG